MPTDNKYGQITLEKGSVPDDEPVVVFRARDIHLPDLLGVYYNFCHLGGSPQKHLNLIADTQHKISEWQAENPERVQTPESASYEVPGNPDLPPPHAEKLPSE